MTSLDSNVQSQNLWEGRSIATQKFRLIEFSAYMEVNAEENVCKFIHDDDYYVQQLNLSIIRFLAVSQTLVRPYCRTTSPPALRIRRCERDL